MSLAGARTNGGGKQSCGDAANRLAQSSKSSMAQGFLNCKPRVAGSLGQLLLSHLVPDKISLMAVDCCSRFSFGYLPILTGRQT